MAWSGAESVKVSNEIVMGRWARKTGHWIKGHISPSPEVAICEIDY